MILYSKFQSDNFINLVFLNIFYFEINEIDKKNEKKKQPFKQPY